jgi:hypothetical protein
MRLRNLHIKQTYTGGVEHLKEARTRWNVYNIKMFKPVCSSKSLLGVKVGGLYIISKLLQLKQTSLKENTQLDASEVKYIPVD